LLQQTKRVEACSGNDGCAIGCAEIGYRGSANKRNPEVIWKAARDEEAVAIVAATKISRENILIGRSI